MKIVIEFNIALKIHRVDKSSIQTTQSLHEKHKNLQFLLTYEFTHLKKKNFLRYCTIKRDYTILRNESNLKGQEVLKQIIELLFLRH